MPVRLCVYECENAPPGQRFMGVYFKRPDGARLGENEERLPIQVPGATRAEAEKKADEWWNGEIQKEVDRVENIRKRNAARKK